MRLNRLRYQLQEGITNIFNHGFMSLASIFVTIACLILMGSSLLVAVNVDNILKTLEDENEIVAYVDENCTEEQSRSLEGIIRAIPNVTGVTYVSKDQAFDDFYEQYENSNLLDDLDSSILRDRYVIFMGDISRMEETLTAVRDVQGIATVSGHLEIAKGFVTLKNVVSAVSLILIAVLVVISLFIMSNTVKLTTFERREEIAIMKMVGATNSYIKLPFVVEGLLLGLFGSLAAYIAEYGIYSLVSTKVVANSGLGFLKLLEFQQLALPILALFLVMGVGVGVIGGLMAIKKFLKV